MKPKLLPQSLDAEKAILGCMMAHQRPAIALVSEKGLLPKHFAFGMNGELYKAILRLWAADAVCDYQSVTVRLKDLGILDKCGDEKSKGATYILFLWTETPPLSSLAYFIGIVMEKAARRDTLEILRETAYNVESEQAEPITKQIEDCRRDLQATIAPACAASITQSAFSKAYANYDQRRPGQDNPPSLGLPTGVWAWDMNLKGIAPGEETLLASRPGGAKTATIETAMAYQMEIGKHVLCFQMDMNPVTMLERMAARRAEINYSLYKRGMAPSGALEEYKQALDEIHEWKDRLHLYSSRITSEQVAAIVMREYEQHGICAFYLDHFLQLKVTGKHRVESLENASGDLRQAINDTGVPGVILVHLDKNSEGDEPQPSHIRWCDKLYGDCDVCVFLWDKLDDPMNPPPEHEILFTVAKERNGNKGTTPMVFKRQYMKLAQP